MSEQRINTPEKFSSQWGFILVLSGFVIGLGNVWRFPQLVGENGGVVFILMYLFFVLVMGIPILTAETMIGRAGGQGPINAMRHLAAAVGASPLWQVLGWMVSLGAFLILAYYSVIASWLLAYLARAAGGLFESSEIEDVTRQFIALISDPEKILAWHTIFMVMVVIISARGVNRGLERGMKLLTPAILVLLLGLVLWGSRLEHFERGLRFLFTPNFDIIGLDQVLAAMGHAFFSLGVGVGGAMAYGAYVSRNTYIGSSVMTVGIVNSVVGLLAGAAILPVVFAHGLEGIAGPNLVFQALPVAFADAPGGHLWGCALLLLLVVAALTTAVALLEPLVSWLQETLETSRVWAAAVVGMFNWLLGVVGVLSFSVWAFDFEFLGQTKGNGVFDLLDILTSHFVLPLSGLLVLVFSAFVMTRRDSAREIGFKHGLDYELWRLAARFLAPLVVLIVLARLLFGHMIHGPD